MEGLHVLCLYPKFTYAKYRLFKRAFFDFSKIWEIEFEELNRIGFDEQAAHELLKWRDAFNKEYYLKLLEKDSIRIISIEDSEYPSLLKNIFDPPVGLFVRGVLTNRTPHFAVVGTRKMTIYGKQITNEIVYDLSVHGVAIVSGLALGIDGIAHKAALHAGGPTIAVLGTGIDRLSVYPRAHYDLSEMIIDKGGALIGEYPPGSEPTTYSFPKRNRIIAGISLGTLVIEADEKSGALITTTCALEYGRDVFAIPHSLTSPTGHGPHKLIREGAYLVRNSQDILEHLKLPEFEKHTHAQETIPDTNNESEILQILSHEPMHIDDITRTVSFPGPTVIALLSVLEMKGRIHNIGNMMYIRKH